MPIIIFQPSIACLWVPMIKWGRGWSRVPGGKSGYKFKNKYLNCQNFTDEEAVFNSKPVQFLQQNEALFWIHIIKLQSRFMEILGGCSEALLRPSMISR